MKAPAGAWLVLLVSIAACRNGGRHTTDSVFTVDTVGDTIVMRSSGPGVWGAVRVAREVTVGVRDGPDEYIFGQIRGIATTPDGALFVYDRQVPALRKYDRHGTYVATFGRSGGGPGEYRSGDGGIAVLRNGRVILRDPGGARINVYDPDGTPRETWRMPGGHYTDSPVVQDSAGRVFTPSRGVLLRVGPRGTPPDTLVPPELGGPPVFLMASNPGGRTTGRALPFHPRASWAWSPLGHFVAGPGAPYVLHVLREGRWRLRVERAWNPVPVGRPERAALEASITESLRGTDPAWRWNGPSIPATKPAYRGILIDADARIWVMVHQRGVERPSTDEDAASSTEWLEPVVFDVFEPHGRFLGTVRLPEPAWEWAWLLTARGEHVWLVEVDALGVQTVARYRIAIAVGR